MRDAAGTFATVAEATLANVLWLATWGLRGAAKLMWLLLDDLTSTISTSPSSRFLKNHTSSCLYPTLSYLVSKELQRPNILINLFKHPSIALEWSFRFRSREVTRYTVRSRFKPQPLSSPWQMSVLFFGSSALLVV